jgi:hypothetical protein
LGTLSNHGTAYGENATDMKNLGERYFKSIMENPSVENALKNLI